MNEFVGCWIVRKGEDPRKVTPEVADAVARHPAGSGCVLCGEDYGGAAVMVLRESPTDIFTGGICGQCAALGDEQFPRKVSGWVTRFRPKPRLVR